MSCLTFATQPSNPGFSMDCSAQTYFTTKADQRYFKPQQENIEAKSSLVTTLAVATVAMVGVLLATQFGALNVSSGGMIGIYVGTGVFGAALLSSIFLKYIYEKSTELPTVVLSYHLLNSNSDLLIQRNATLVKVGDSKQYVARRTTGEEGIRYMPVVKLPDDFEQSQIPEGKKLYVSQDQEVKVMTSKGSQPLTLGELQKPLIQNAQDFLLTSDLINFTIGLGVMNNKEDYQEDLVHTIAAAGTPVQIPHPKYVGHYEIITKPQVVPKPENGVKPENCDKIYHFFVAKDKESINQEAVKGSVFAFYLNEKRQLCSCHDDQQNRFRSVNHISFRKLISSIVFEDATCVDRPAEQ